MFTAPAHLDVISRAQASSLLISTMLFNFVALVALLGAASARVQLDDRILAVEMKRT